MSNYTPLVNYAAKDALTTGNPSKKILGTEISAELSAIATAITSKEDTANKNIANGYLGLDANSQVSAAGYIVTGSTVPANGLYLPAANTPGLASNSTLRWSVNSSGAHVFAPASSGSTIRTPDAYIGLAGSTNNPRIEASATEANGNVELNFTGSVATGTASIKRFSTSVLDISAARNVTVNTPSSGTTLTISANNAANALVAGNMGIGYDIGLRSSANNLYWSGTADAAVGTTSSGSLWLYAGGGGRVQINSTGNVLFNAPSSGATIAATFAASSNGFTFTDGTVSGAIGTGGTQLNFGSTSAHALGLATNNSTRILVGSGGNVFINTAASGDELTVSGSVVASLFAGDLVGNASTATALQTARTINGVSFNGTANITVTASADTLTGSTLPALSGANLTSLNAANLTGTVNTARISGAYTGITSIGDSATVNGFTVGYRQIPRSTTTTTAVVGDVGKCIAASAGITIPNSTFAAGDALSIYNDSASSITITQAAGLTLRLGGTTTTGNLTLQPRGMITVWFNSASEAIVTGAGVA